MHWLTDHTFKPYPELLIFLTVAIGFLLGRLHWKAIGLGAMTGCLIAGPSTGWAVRSVR